MPLSYEQFADIISNSGESFTYVEVRTGKVHRFSGRDFNTFKNRTDARLHEHKVFDSAGRLVYHRDVNGVVREGAGAQDLKADKTRAKGSVLLWGLRGKPDNVLGDIVRNGVNWGTGRRRRR